MESPGKHPEVLMVDHDIEVGREVMAYLSARAYAVTCVEDSEKAYNQLDARPFDVLVTELRAARIDGTRVMQVALDRNPHICVVFTTGQPDIEAATEAMRGGAYDFQVKPLNLGKLEAVIEHGLAFQQLAMERVALQRRLDERFGLRSLVGQSRQMVRVYTAVRQFSPRNDPVLIHGEPGTGKDLIAQAIHNGSPRRDAPFVKFAAADASSRIAARELFGVATREGEHTPGRFELADGGTLYLDGLEYVALPLQKRILRYLREGVVEHGGHGRKVAVQVRLIASTAHRPETHVERGELDPRLAETFGAVTIEAPPLRGRAEDVPLTVVRILAEYAEEHGAPGRALTREALDALGRHGWPGNVRELRNVVEGMAASADHDGPLGLEDLPEQLREQPDGGAPMLRLPLGSSMEAVERLVIAETLQYAGYNKEKCAETLGIGLRTLYRKVKLYGIPTRPSAGE